MRRPTMQASPRYTPLQQRSFLFDACHTVYALRGATNVASKTAVMVLVGAAIALGFVLLIGAIALPIVTPQSPPSFSPPFTSTSSAGAVASAPSPTAAVRPAPPTAGVPQITLVEDDGYAVLLLVALPMFASLMVGLLLRTRVAMGSRSAGTVAWILAIIVLAGGVVGFVTFLIGLAVVPIGLLLVIACARAGPPSVSPTGVA